MRTRKMMNRVGSRVGRTSGGGALFSVKGILAPTAWYDATQETGYSDGGAMTAIVDWSGNSNNLAGNATYKTAIQNGLPIFRFNGSTDLMTKVFTLNQPCFRFIVFKLLAVNGGAQSGVADGGAGAQCLLYFATGASAPLQTYAGVVQDVSAAYGTATFERSGVVYNGASSKAVKGTSSITTISPGALGMGGATLGGRADSAGFGQVDIGEVIIGSGALSDAVINAAMAYLKNKWGVT